MRAKNGYVGRDTRLHWTSIPTKSMTENCPECVIIFKDIFLITIVSLVLNVGRNHRLFSERCLLSVLDIYDTLCS